MSISHQYFAAFILTLTVTATVPLAARDNSGQQKSLSTTVVYDTGVFDGNRIKSELENNGMIVSHRISGHSGLEWPQGNRTYAVFASGLWYAGKVNGEVRTACAEYGPERVPGPYGSDQTDPRYRLYKINHSDFANPSTSTDFQYWPVDDGAPWVDVNNDGIYSPLPTGPDHPDLLGDQMIWYVSNDGDSAAHHIFGTDPLGIEVQTTIFGIGRQNVLGDIMFVKELIINRGGNTIEDMYIGIWSDPDLGDAGDDLVGCDTTLGMGICYNDGIDADYAGFSGGTPALGYDFFQGPVVPASGDTALYQSKQLPGYHNLKMSAFRYYLCTSDPQWQDPNSAEEAYYFMAGLNKSGQPLDESVTGGGRFMSPGDPTKDTGPDDTEFIQKDIAKSCDATFLMSSGPFTMAPRDSQEVVFGIIIAADGDALSSYLRLKKVDVLAQWLYDNRFTLPTPPPPIVEATALENEIILTWDNQSEAFINIFSPSEQYGDSSYFSFQGYRVWQYSDKNGSDPVLLATYDIIDGIKKLYDQIYVGSIGQVVEAQIIDATDSGLKHSHQIKPDVPALQLLLNRAYYYGVTAYACGYNHPLGQQVVESDPQIIEVRPQIHTDWSANDSTASYGDVLPTNHIQGVSDGTVIVKIIDPTKLTGHDYEITFEHQTLPGNDSLIITTWNLVDATMNSELLSDQTNINGVDARTGITVGSAAGPIVDGFQVIITGPGDGIHGVWQVANADGPIAGIDTDVNENIMWINFLTAPDYPTEQAQGGWFFFGHAGGVPLFMSTADGTGFLDCVFRGDNYSWALPYDFEIRFTADALVNGMGYLRFSNNTIIHVPFELWNLGTTPDDPGDDYRMLPAIYKDVGPDPLVWGFGGDAAHSGVANDPYSDWVYWGNPDDVTPGQAGYDAFFTAGIGGMVNGGWTEVIAQTLLMNWNGYVSRVDSIALTNLSSTDPAAWTAADTALFEATGWFLDASNNLGVVKIAGNYATGRILGMPEVGTVYRMITNKPSGSDDLFAFTTAGVSGDSIHYRPQLIKVWPNPYFGYNPEEGIGENKVHFTHLPESGRCVIRIFDLSGIPIRRIDHSAAGTQFAEWELTNNYHEPVVGGIYIIHIETEQGDQVLKLAMVKPHIR
ncbi:MAG: hypothetical protein ABIA75_05765 [Candidatus Neomarinimicrobiota bacterium]